MLDWWLIGGHLMVVISLLFDGLVFLLIDGWLLVCEYDAWQIDGYLMAERCLIGGSWLFDGLYVW